jgi:hypothetical protein
MMFATLVYNIASDATGTNDLLAATDPEFSQRNSHYIFTEDFRLLATGLFGAHVIRGRYQVPTWNAIGEDTIFNSNRGLEPVSNSQLDWYVDNPKPIPKNEEFQVQTVDSGGGTEIENAVLWIGSADWSPTLPRGVLPIVVRATGTTTWALNGWTALAQLTLSQSLRGGVYSVLGAILQADDALAFRLVFPRQRMYMGRRLRPGWYCQNAVGDVVGLHTLPESSRLGEWGRFHTFELPQLEVFGTAADSTAWVLFMWCQFLGEDVNLLSNWAGGGGTF